MSVEGGRERGRGEFFDFFKISNYKDFELIYSLIHIHTRTYNTQNTERILMRYVDNWNLFGLDIMNECHDHASWGKGDVLTDFNTYVEKFMLFIHEKIPQFRGLFFVEGVSERGRDGAKAYCGFGTSASLSYLVFGLFAFRLLIFPPTSSPPLLLTDFPQRHGKSAKVRREEKRKGGREGRGT